MPDLRLYEGREQTYIKHFFLDHYLEVLALITGSTQYDTINYVDCFAGPWGSRDREYSDTSFAIAVRAFRSAQEQLAKRGRRVNLRFMFLEKRRKAFIQLAAYAAGLDGVVAKTLNDKLESAVPEIIDFIRDGGKRAFTFTFIDPLGWKGFALDYITPLLKVQPGEVLINFMTGFIRRFINAEDAATRATFLPMYGEDIHGILEGLSGLEREEAAIREYMKRVKKRGGFTYAGLAIVFKPEVETTQFHLIYATRGDKGVEKFKEIERKAMDETVRVRALLKQQKFEPMSS